MIVACLRRKIVFCAIFALVAATWEQGATYRAQTPAARRSQQRANTNDKLLADGLAALERGDSSTAHDLFERALTADPRNAEAHTYLGVLADRAGDLNKAEQHFAMAAQLAPQSARTRNN